MPPALTAIAWVFVILYNDELYTSPEGKEILRYALFRSSSSVSFLVNGNFAECSNYVIGAGLFTVGKSDTVKWNSTVNIITPTAAGLRNYLFQRTIS